MNKKLMAVAVAGALAVPAIALAETSAVELYGRANMGFSQYQATGASVGSQADFLKRGRIYDNGSRLGVRGSEDLGGGMKALIVIESGVNIDNGQIAGQGGIANTSAGTFASRDSYVGIGGNWGDVRWGRQSIFWSNGIISQMAANYVETEIPFANGASFGRVSGPTARTPNVISYNSPTVSGFNGSVSYSPNFGAGSNSSDENAGVGVSTDGSIKGITLRYFGKVNGQFDWCVNESNTPAAATGARPKVTGTKIGIGLPYAPGAQISLIYSQNKNQDVAGTALFTAVHDSVTQHQMTLNWEHIMGNIQFLAMVGKLQAAKGCTETVNPNPGVTGTTCSGTEASGVMLAVRYLMSKRTALYVSYNSVTNGANQISDYTGGSITSANNGTAQGIPGTSAGADPRLLAFGMVHNF
jgi:predicted porin